MWEVHVRLTSTRHRSKHEDAAAFARACIGVGFEFTGYKTAGPDQGPMEIDEIKCIYLGVDRCIKCPLFPAKIDEIKCIYLKRPL